MSSGCVYTHPLCCSGAFMLRKVLGYYIHIGVGFEVACLSELGKFDGLKSEMSNKCESHAFFVSCIEPTSYTKGPI